MNFNVPIWEQWARMGWCTFIWINCFRLTVSELIDILATDDDVLESEIALLPPVWPLSDEDSGDEDDNNLERLSGNQLLAEAEASVRKIIDGEVVVQAVSPAQLLINESSNPRHDKPTGTQCPESSSSKRSTTSRSQQNISHETSSMKKNKKHHWVKQDIATSQEKEFELPEWLRECDGDPVKLFELFYDTEVIQIICDFTNLYAFQKGEPNLNIKPEEVRIFLAILLVSGYCQVPRYRMYWEQSPDCHNSAISEAMSRNRFCQIMRYLHVCDNNELNKDDRFAKVAPLWKLMNEKWLKYFPGEMNLCVDESMIPYFGRHGAKQHMHGKPIRFGYKAWSLCTRLGYLIQANLYQGAKTGNTVPEVGVGGSVVLDLINKLPEKEFSVFFDNFFTSITLLEKLKEKGLKGTGTIRSNRIEKAPLIDQKLLSKQPRGSFDQVTESHLGITLVRYHDNSIVTVASTQAGASPITKARRYSQANKKHILIDQPSCVVLYNTYMGGVDRMDENIAKMRVNVRGKKWYWQLFSFPLNCSINNAWQLHRWARRSKADQLDLLGFTRHICLAYLQKYSQKGSPGRPVRLVKSVDKRVTDFVRFDGVNHFIIQNDKQSRCGQCKKNARMMCNKCKIALHTHCFPNFHTK